MDNQKGKENTQKIFDAASHGYDGKELRFFSDSSKVMISEMKLSGSEKVLDVATGTGYCALEIAKSLPGGKVVGIDLSSGMLEKAQAKMNSQGIENAEFKIMDMEVLEFADEHFDIAVCSFGIFFIEDMQGLLQGISKKVKGDGKIVVSTFTESSFTPLTDLFMKRLKKYGVQIPEMPSRNVNSKEKCFDLFSSAGFSEVAVVEKDLGYFLKNSSEWWNVIQGAAFRGLVSQLPAEKLAVFKEEHLTEVENLKTGDGIWLEVKVLYTTGMK